MTIDEKIKAVIEKHQQILANGNSDIHEIQWKIEDTPYPEFKAWREKWNTNNEERRYKEENNLSDRMYIMLHSWDLGVDKLRIDIYSVPVKVKHEYIVEQL